MIEQATLLRNKKLARMAKMAKQPRAQVQRGVVRYEVSTTQKPTEIRHFAVPPPPKRVKQAPVENSKVQPQKIDPRTIIQQKRTKGCSGCSRKMKSSGAA